MTTQEYSDPRMRSALYELREYLLDRIPPLSASDALETLFDFGPEPLVGELQAWITTQSQLQEGATVTDYVFHALRKIHHLGDLKLIERAPLQDYLDRVMTRVVGLCPEEDRDPLRKSFAQLSRGESGDVGGAGGAIATGMVRRGGAPKPARTERVDDEVATSLKRFDAMARSLRRPKTQIAAAANAEGKRQNLAQFLTMAAVSSTSRGELEQNLARLAELGFDKAPPNIFKALGDALPPWEIELPPELAAQMSPAPIQAMRKIAGMSADTGERTTRLTEMVMGAIEQFNEGALAAALSMLELAQIIVDERQVDAVRVDSVREQAANAISADQLRKYTENRARHTTLRKVLNFFPAMTAEGLLDALRAEPKRERRRGILSLLEVHGDRARTATLARMDIAINGQPPETDTYYQRNLVYLLHRNPRPADAPVEKEMEYLAKWTTPGTNAYVVKEALVALATLKGEGAEKLLSQRFSEYEGMLMRSEFGTYGLEELQMLLDRAAAALARMGTPEALRKVATHGMRVAPQLGDTRSRLSYLAGHDLSVNEMSVVAPLLKALRDELPGKVLGMTVVKKQGNPRPLVEALAATRSPAVRQLLEEIATKFPDQDLGKMAAKSLAPPASEKEKAAAAPAASLSGDLQFFALPTLMQSLGDSRSTGLLVLKSKTGEAFGKLALEGGRVRDAQAGPLRGVLAVYQLFECPVAGSFAFMSRADFGAAGAVTHDIMSLLLEGLRRHDELRMAATVVPDDMQLKATGTKPSPAPMEVDPAVLRDLWLKGSAGETPLQLEKTIPADSYTVRRLLSHWVEEGSLTPAD